MSRPDSPADCTCAEKHCNGRGLVRLPQVAVAAAVTLFLILTVFSARASIPRVRLLNVPRPTSSESAPCTLNTEATGSTKSTGNAQPIPATSKTLTLPKLNIVTLAVGSRSDHKLLEHNCALVSRTQHRYIVQTDADKLNQTYCKACECRLHKPANCKCPDPKPGAGLCFLCEKQRFYIDRLLEFGTVVWHDSDLVFLREDFFDKLAMRSLINDFLATYVPNKWKPTDYFGWFNSGLFFMRKVPGVDFGALESAMYDHHTNSDQKALSLFVRKHIKNWDTLSFRYHCRFLERVGYDIPPSECLTLHDRGEQKEVFRKLNFTLQTVS